MMKNSELETWARFQSQRKQDEMLFSKDFCLLLCVLKGMVACENDHVLPNEVIWWAEVGNIYLFSLLMRGFVASAESIILEYCLLFFQK